MRNQYDGHTLRRSAHADDVLPSYDQISNLSGRQHLPRKHGPRAPGIDDAPVHDGGVRSVRAYLDIYQEEVALPRVRRSNLKRQRSYPRERIGQ